MILSKVYEDAERRLERNEITIGEFGRLVDIEVIEPKRGEWEEKETFRDGDDEPIIEEWQSARCSVCHKYHTTPYMYYFNNYNFCPNCGADMREREGE